MLSLSGGDTPIQYILYVIMHSRLQLIMSTMWGHCVLGWYVTVRVFFLSDVMSHPAFGFPVIRWVSK